jgi:signal recognition particle GTPase
MKSLLVADALTGQDAVNLAKSFDERDRHHRHRADPYRR